MKAASFLTDIDQMESVIKGTSKDEKVFGAWISETLDIMKAMLTSCDAETLKLLSEDERCLSYNLVRDNSVVWLPFFTVETVIILNAKEDIESFGEFITSDPFELKWTAPILDVLNNPKLNTHFKRTSCCRLIINDPYLTTREYKLLYPASSDKPYLFI
jgi:hypothetical protein